MNTEPFIVGALPVPAPDFNRIRPDDFADEDYIRTHVWPNDRRGIPYYFKHFHMVANAVRLEEPNRGFIDIVVHRSPENNFPYNARVQENHLWFAYFYTKMASWNIYYGMEQVRYRFEAILEHLLTLQGPEGAFSEYSPNGYNLAGTSFAVQFMGQSIRLLEEAKTVNPSFPFISKELYVRVKEAMRKAILHVLSDRLMWEHGTGFTNQYTLMWSASAAYLSYWPDEDIEAKLHARIVEAQSAFISPAGFYYEDHGFDMSYNLGVHSQNMMADYYYFKDDNKFVQHIIAKESRFIEWLSYNLVLEPDGSFFTSNAAASRRSTSSHIERKDMPLAEKLPLARAFVKSQEEVAAEIPNAKSNIVKDGIWPNVPDLTQHGGNSYNPFGLYNHILYRYYPTNEERAEAIAQLPYRVSDRFNHQRCDSRSGLQFTYARRAHYYATFQAGPQKSGLQVLGLGLLWHPEAGIMVSSQTESAPGSTSRGLSWGTKNASASHLYESEAVLATYRVNGHMLQPAIGYGDVAQGQMEVKFDLGTNGTKTVQFLENGIRVQISHAEPFVEYVPITVKTDDNVTLSSGIFTLIRGKVNMQISCNSLMECELERMDYQIYNKQIHQLKLQGCGELTYTITFIGQEESRNGK